MAFEVALAPDLIARLAVGALVAYGVSALFAWLVIRFGPGSGMLDLPGQRRSHNEPTPRGGGAGILLVAACGMWIAAPLPLQVSLALASTMLAVGLVGWLDDRRGLPVIPRLLVQAAAASMAALALAGNTPTPGFVALGALGVVALTNVVNFMDGSDGMATLESLFLAVAGMLLAGAAGQGQWSLWSLMLAAACLGFLPFNLPRARVFLGDVGSTTLGFCLGVLALGLMASGALSIWQALLLASAFLADAGFTLASRVLRGRRWYTAHREHTYQWLIRSGFSHPGVAAAYMAWNLLLVTPLVVLGIQRPDWQPAMTAAAYAVAWLVWTGARRWCLRRATAEVR